MATKTVISTTNKLSSDSTAFQEGVALQSGDDLVFGAGTSLILASSITIASLNLPETASLCGRTGGSGGVGGNGGDGADGDSGGAAGSAGSTGSTGSAASAVVLTVTGAVIHDGDICGGMGGIAGDGGNGGAGGAGGAVTDGGEGGIGGTGGTGGEGGNLSIAIQGTYTRTTGRFLSGSSPNGGSGGNGGDGNTNGDLGNAGVGGAGGSGGVSGKGGKVFVSTPANGSVFIDVTTFDFGSTGSTGADGTGGNAGDSAGGQAGSGGTAGDHGDPASVIASSNLHLLISTNYVDGAVSVNNTGTIVKSTGTSVISNLDMSATDEYISGTTGTQTSITLPASMQILALPNFVSCTFGNPTTITYWDNSAVLGAYFGGSGAIQTDDGVTFSALFGVHMGSGVIYA